VEYHHAIVSGCLYYEHRAAPLLLKETQKLRASRLMYENLNKNCCIFTFIYSSSNQSSK
jgi:hypothetical protein